MILFPDIDNLCIGDDIMFNLGGKMVRDMSSSTFSQHRQACTIHCRCYLDDFDLHRPTRVDSLHSGTVTTRHCAVFGLLPGALGRWHYCYLSNLLVDWTLFLAPRIDGV